MAMCAEEELVESAYRLLFNRGADPAGLRHWSHLLQAGMPRAEFLLAMVNSAEFRATAGITEGFGKYQDVDLIIPVQGQCFRVPATDRSLVPYLLSDRQWEPHLSQYLRLSLQPDHVFMDVGANLGYFTVTCAPLVKTVIAFEPAAVTYRYCEMNIALNGLNNVQLFPYGLWSEDTVLGMAIDQSQLMGAHLRQTGPSDTTVSCVSLDSLIAKGGMQLARLDVLKMDVEGAEVEALLGMRHTIAHFRPRMLLEVNRPTLAQLGKEPADIWRLLSGLSYRLEAFVDWGHDSRQPIRNLPELERLCPPDGLIDILAVPG
jgi:FkbM family methyltransferase